MSAHGDGVPLVAAMQELWARAFDLEHVAADADFFELGGSSLLAAQLVASLSEVVGGEVSLRAFFESASIDALADRITEEHGTTHVAPERLEKAMRLAGADDLFLVASHLDPPEDSW